MIDTDYVLIDGGQRDTLARHSGTVGGIKIEPLFQNVLTFQPIEDSAMHTRPKWQTVVNNKHINM